MATSVSIEQALGRVEGGQAAILQAVSEMRSEARSDRDDHKALRKDHMALQVKVSTLSAQLLTARRIVYALGAAVAWALGNPYIVEHLKQ